MIKLITIMKPVWSICVALWDHIILGVYMYLCVDMIRYCILNSSKSITETSVFLFILALFMSGLWAMSAMNKAAKLWKNYYKN